MSGYLRRRTVLSGIGASALSVAGGTAVARADAKDNVKVGVLVDLSGRSRLHGQRQLAGIEVAALRSNRNPDQRGVTLAVRDTQGDLIEAERAARELLSTEGVHAIVGTSSGRTLPPVLGLTGQAGIPLMVPSAGEEAVTETHAFRSAPSSHQIVAAMVSDLARTGHRTVAVIAGVNPVNDEWIRLLTSRLAEASLSVSGVERYQLPVTDLIGPITRAMATKPDALIVRGMPPNNGIAARDARAVGWTGSLYCGTAAATPIFLAAAGPAADGARVLGHWALIAGQAPPTVPNHEEMTAFVADFERTRGPVGAYTCYGADALMLIHHAAQHSADPADIRDALERSAYQGVTGSFQFSPAHHSGLSDDSVVMLTVANGAWTLAT